MRSVERSFSKYAILQALCAAILIVLGFPPLGWWPATLAGYAWFLVGVFERKSQGLATVTWFGSVFFFTQLILFHWLSNAFHYFHDYRWVTATILALISIVLLTTFYLAAAVAWLSLRWLMRCERVEPSVLVAVPFFALMELLHTWWFVWAPYWSIAGSHKLLSSVYILGDVGWSLLFVTTAFVLARSWISYRSRARSISASVFSALSGLFFFAASGYSCGILAERSLRASFKATQAVAVVQHPPYSVEQAVDRTFLLDLSALKSAQQTLVDTLAQQYQRSGIKEQLWTVWGESSHDRLNIADAADLSLLHRWTNTLSGVQFVGLDIEAQPIALDQPTLKHNVMMMIRDNVEEYHLYRKTVLFPFAETVPGAGLFPWLARLFGEHLISAGSDSPILEHETGEVLFIRLICWEALVRSYVYEAVARAKATRPEASIVLVQTSNDLWFDSTLEVVLHSLAVRWRAATLGLPLIRASKTGGSEIVAPWGEIIARANLKGSEILLARLPVRRSVLGNKVIHAVGLENTLSVP